MSGVLHTDNVLHIYCLKFCFNPAIRNELQHHAHHWNKHRVQKMKNVRSLSEIPIMMYTTAELNCCTEQSKVADEVEVDHCLQIKTVMNVISIILLSKMFSDWALSVIEQYRFQMQTNLDRAFELFSNLIMEIYASEKILNACK
jgi:hypothetical protein